MSLHQLNPSSSTGAWEKRSRSKDWIPMWHWEKRDMFLAVDLCIVSSFLMLLLFGFFCLFRFFLVFWFCLVDILLCFFPQHGSHSFPFPLTFHPHGWTSYERLTHEAFDLIITVDWLELIREKPSHSEHIGCHLCWTTIYNNAN